MNRRDFFAFSGAGVMASLTPASLSAAPAAPFGGPSSSVSGAEVSQMRSALSKRQNIVIFMPDEMRADSLGCYENPVVKTPNYDRVAREGARFEQCHVQFPVCGASRCAMLTGWPTSVRGHRSLYYFLRPEEPNLFRYLRQAGYDVFWFGKNDALAQASVADSVTEWSSDQFVIKSPARDATPGIHSMYLTNSGDRRNHRDYKHLQQGMEILRRKEQNAPFCLFLPMAEPHPPYSAPEGFQDMYSPDQVGPLAPPDLKNKPAYHEGIRRRYNLGQLDDATLRKIRAVYFGKVSYSDWLLGELLSTLEETGRNKDTALLITSDHGDYAGDYGLIEKWPSGLEDCLTRVPMIARIPGAPAGVTSHEMIEMYDLMQTCLDVAGTRATHTHFSRSLAPQIFGGPGDVLRAAFSEGGYNVYEPQCFEAIGAGGGPYEGKIGLQNDEPVTVSRSAMVRTKTHKLIMRPQDQCELYDIAEDPKETQNLYGMSSSTDIQRLLEGRLLNHYINTTGISPMDRDPRDFPKPAPPPRTDIGQQHVTEILDR